MKNRRQNNTGMLAKLIRKELITIRAKDKELIKELKAYKWH